MPIDFIQERKKQKYLIAIVLAVFVITGVILWFGYFRKPEPVLEEVPPLIGVKEIKIDFSVLENPFLQQLQPFEQVSPFEGEIGRENPFLPY